MKDGLRYIVGKRIAAVVAAASPRPPHRQVFLVFDDGTRFEFWGESFSCCSGLDQAAGIERYVKSGGGEIKRAYGKSLDAAGNRSHPLTTGPEDMPAYHVSPPENLQSLLERDWAAWEEAKAAIGKARKR